MSLEHGAKRLQMDRNIPFVNEVFCILEGSGSEARAIELLNSAERKHELELSTVQPYPPPDRLPDELYSEYVRERLHGFWSTTHLILSAAHASRLFILFSNRFLCTMGLREWGGEAANWANRTAWLNRTEWTSGDFTGGLNDSMISGYNEWSRLVMHLLTQKSKPRADVVKQDLYRLVQLVNQRDLNVDVRLDVVTTLASLGTPETRSELEDVLAAETDERMVGSIKYYLSMIDNQDKI